MASEDSSPGDENVSQRPSAQDDDRNQHLPTHLLRRSLRKSRFQHFQERGGGNATDLTNRTKQLRIVFLFVSRCHIGLLSMVLSINENIQGAFETGIFVFAAVVAELLN